MPRQATVLAEVLAFIADQGGRVERPVVTLARDWDGWRSQHHLERAASGTQTFRQALLRAEQAGYIRLLRADSKVTGVEVIGQVEPDAAARLRLLERERASFAGKFRQASPDAARDLFDLRTPALSAYLRRRRVVEKARREFERNGLDPAAIGPQLDPLGEEALALKERAVRTDIELMGWRALGERMGLKPDPVAPARLTAAAIAAAPARAVARGGRGHGATRPRRP